MGFKVQGKKKAITIDLEKVIETGEVVTKPLVFACNYQSADFLRGLSNMMRKLDEFSNHEITIDDIEPLVDAERLFFEAAVPGKWDEYFDFLEHNYVDMGNLVTHMFHLVMSEHMTFLEEKREAASPVIPEDGEKI